MYKCLQCSKEITSVVQGFIRCPSCGSKVFSKTRDPVSKTVKSA